MPEPTRNGESALSRLDVGNLRGSMSDALSGFGGYLRCEVCKTTQPLGDPGHRVMSGGWPKCCGYTMRWWTQRQLDAGEHLAEGLLP